MQSPVAVKETSCSNIFVRTAVGTRSDAVPLVWAQGMKFGWTSLSTLLSAAPEEVTRSEIVATSSCFAPARWTPSQLYRPIGSFSTTGAPFLGPCKLFFNFLFFFFVFDSSDGAVGMCNNINNRQATSVDLSPFRRLSTLFFFWQEPWPVFGKKNPRRLLSAGQPWQEPVYFLVWPSQPLRHTHHCRACGLVWLRLT